MAKVIKNKKFLDQLDINIHNKAVQKNDIASQTQRKELRSFSGISTDSDNNYRTTTQQFSSKAVQKDNFFGNALTESVTSNSPSNAQKKVVQLNQSNNRPVSQSIARGKMATARHIQDNQKVVQQLKEERAKQLDNNKANNALNKTHTGWFTKISNTNNARAIQGKEKLQSFYSPSDKASFRGEQYKQITERGDIHDHFSDLNQGAQTEDDIIKSIIKFFEEVDFNRRDFAEKELTTIKREITRYYEYATKILRNEYNIDYSERTTRAVMTKISTFKKNNPTLFQSEEQEQISTILNSAEQISELSSKTAQPAPVPLNYSLSINDIPHLASNIDNNASQNTEPPQAGIVEGIHQVGVRETVQNNQHITQGERALLNSNSSDSIALNNDSEERVLVRGGVSKQEDGTGQQQITNSTLIPLNALENDNAHGKRASFDTLNNRTSTDQNMNKTQSKIAIVKSSKEIVKILKKNTQSNSEPSLSKAQGRGGEKKKEVVVPVNLNEFIDENGKPLKKPTEYDINNAQEAVAAAKKKRSAINEEPKHLIQGYPDKEVIYNARKNDAQQAVNSTTSVLNTITELYNDYEKMVKQQRLKEEAEERRLAKEVADLKAQEDLARQQAADLEAAKAAEKEAEKAEEAEKQRLAELKAEEDRLEAEQQRLAELKAQEDLAKQDLAKQELAKQEAAAKEAAKLKEIEEARLAELEQQRLKEESEKAEKQRLELEKEKQKEAEKEQQRIAKEAEELKAKEDLEKQKAAELEQQRLADLKAREAKEAEEKRLAKEAEFAKPKFKPEIKPSIQQSKTTDGLLKSSKQLQQSSDAASQGTQNLDILSENVSEQLNALDGIYNAMQNTEKQQFLSNNMQKNVTETLSETQNANANRQAVVDQVLYELFQSLQNTPQTIKDRGNGVTSNNRFKDKSGRLKYLASNADVNDLPTVADINDLDAHFNAICANPNYAPSYASAENPIMKHKEEQEGADIQRLLNKLEDSTPEQRERFRKTLESRIEQQKNANKTTTAEMIFVNVILGVLTIGIAPSVMSIVKAVKLSLLKDELIEYDRKCVKEDKNTAQMQQKIEDVRNAAGKGDIEAFHKAKTSMSLYADQMKYDTQHKEFIKEYGNHLHHDAVENAVLKAASTKYYFGDDYAGKRADAITAILADERNKEFIPEGMSNNVDKQKLKDLLKNPTSFTNTKTMANNMEQRRDTKTMANNMEQRRGKGLSRQLSSNTLIKFSDKNQIASPDIAKLTRPKSAQGVG